MESVVAEVVPKKSPNASDLPLISTLDILKSQLDELSIERIIKPRRRRRNKIKKKEEPVSNSKENVLDFSESTDKDSGSETKILSEVDTSQLTESKQELGKKKRNRGEKKQGKNARKERSEKCPNLLPVDEAKRLFEEQDPENVQYIEGYISINPTNPKLAYVPLDGEELDLLIFGIRGRNKALDGDLIVASINPIEEWHVLPSKQKQKTGTVICILEELHTRKAVGYLNCGGKQPSLQPRDMRIPLIRLQKNDAMIKDFINKRFLHTDFLFLVEIVSWKEPLKPFGRVVNVLGKTDAIETETAAILLDHNINTSPYSKEMVEELPGPDYALTELDIKDREDWRQECVFTIDPSTAVDLDDAVSCKLLENGNYEIGVHIADVTHFLKFLSPLDLEVAKRATTVYLTDNVYHMLPKKLCEICSLLPGQERLTFSVIWEISPEAEIIKHRFAKTIIKSCYQMSYDHAQMIIENPDENWPDSFPSVNGDFSQTQLTTAVTELYKLSVHLRRKRYANGALSINQIKLSMLLDKDTGLPKSYVIDEQRESNRLIEEFMLLANMTVATHLFSVEPQTALLRNHVKPKARLLSYAKELLEQLGVHLNTKSSASLEDSIKRYELEMESEAEEFPGMVKYRMMVINRLCVKAMARATYKCSSTIKTETELKHYALNVPFYTHFTSPIRRYVDCMVHRQLYSSIIGIPLPSDWTKNMCIRIAAHSNIKKYNAKLAQDESAILYFTYFVSLTGPFVALAIVAEIKEQSMTLILCQAGIKLKINYRDIKKDATVEYSNECLVNSVVVRWNKPAMTEIFSMFTLASVQLQKDPKCFRLCARLLPPQQ